MCQTAFGTETVCYPLVYPLLGWGFKHEYHVFGLRCGSEWDAHSGRKEVGRKVGKQGNLKMKGKKHMLGYGIPNLPNHHSSSYQ